MENPDMAGPPDETGLPEGPELEVADGAPATAEVPALRDAVLSGRFFSAGFQDDAERVAEFGAVRGAATVAAWFGAAAAARLGGRRDGIRLALDRDIAAIDALIAEQLDAILHHPRLARLEGSWRGLFWLADGFEPGNRIKVKVLSAAWSEICRDLERAPEFDQSHMFRKIYEDEFGMPGGEPYGLLIIDHEVRHRPAPGAPTDDVTALKLLAAVAAAAFVPTVLAAAPSLLEVDGFADLAGVADPAAPLRTADYVRWRGLFTQEDIRFVAVTLPRVLARPPWRDDPARHDGFRYQEFAGDAEARVWTNAGYGFAATVVRAFAAFAWPADVRGVETDRRAGGLVDELPIEPFTTDAGTSWARPSLEVVLTDRQERILVDAGLMPLSSIPFTEDAVFGAVRSLQAPQNYSGPTAAAANANARLSTQINTLLCVSRFAHYVKMLGRSMVGSFRTGDEIERQLQSWLSGFVNSNVSSGSDARAKYPLVSGRVTVRERPGRPGVFGCVVQLQPYFQLDDVSAQFRLTTDIVAPGASLR
jgi:type VI secretion system protein ImpD/type VI secretion system protein ImpC